LWLLVGLGNPGRRYARTRHNVGFLVLDALADSLGVTFQEKDEYRMTNGSMGDERVILLEPLTFMNRSGPPVRKVLTRRNIEPDRLVVVHDDLDLDTGRLKIRRRGSSGGHKGIESIIQSIGTNEFIRVKVGIGRDVTMLVEDYVLSKFRREEVPLINEATERAMDAIRCIIREGAEKAMNRFH